MPLQEAGAVAWEQEEGPELDAASALDALAEEGDEGDPDGSDAEATVPPGRLPAGRQAILRRCEALQPAPRLALAPRPYQEDALGAWLESGGRGVVVLPTGAGKTVVALMAVARL